MSDDFAVRCKSCRFRWNTPAMAEGLRVIGACPKCTGELEFGTRGAGLPPEGLAERDSRVSPEAPHMVLGIPRI
jgi:hypothetical protein